MSALQTVALVIFLVTLVQVIRSTDVREIWTSSSSRLAITNATALVMLLWFLRLHTSLGPDIHFLMTGALTLTLGFRAATLSASLCLLVLCLAGQSQWVMIGVNGIAKVLLPIGITYIIFALSWHKLPRNFLVYIFLCAFLPAALVLAISMLTLGGYYVLDDVYSAQAIIDNYLMIIPLMLFPEALLNGVAITLLVIYKPEWVNTFHDKFYFDNDQ
ncbi:energy-coupling factor ABC transporter permease [Salinimonas chungwhensis]|uniref:energy-coupling factor ABC transporter permease n=1 Tax=Salinimonas chungwhensis TaxID=265425 RepID=UPI00037C67E6|nr:energy-coupling factor ABC transporter permease [Salinimonas chungwhensis]